MTSNPANPGRLPVLVNLSTHERFVLDGPSITIGRAPGNTVLLTEDEFASGKHARIYWQDGKWWLEDRNSSNGTRVNNEIITERWKLSPKDVIKIGRTSFRIE